MYNLNNTLVGSPNDILKYFRFLIKGKHKDQFVLESMGKDQFYSIFVVDGYKGENLLIIDIYEDNTFKISVIHENK